MTDIETENPFSSLLIPTEAPTIPTEPQTTTLILLDHVTDPHTGPAAMQSIDGEVTIVASGDIEAPGIIIEVFKGADWVHTPPALIITAEGSSSFTADHARAFGLNPCLIYRPL